MGSVAYRRGWLDEAMQNYNLAVQMEPGNLEYRQALAMMQQGGQATAPTAAERWWTAWTAVPPCCA